MAASTSRRDAQQAFVLHSYPFRETSLVVEVFSRECGRVAVVARGARRPRSALRGVLLAFQPLLLAWSGKGEVKTLHKAEWQGGFLNLKGLPLICGFYLNELLIKLLHRDDPHEQLYTAYEEALRALGGSGDVEPVLRQFEQALLRELGYALTLDRDADTGRPVLAQTRYRYLVERGPVEAGRDAPENGIQLDGQTLLDMQCGDYSRSATQQQSKLLMRALINHYLGTQVLHTRQLLRDFQDMGESAAAVES